MFYRYLLTSSYTFALGGSDLGDIVRRILRRLLDNTFLAQFSMQGFKGKKSFKKLFLCKVISGVYHCIY